MKKVSYLIAAISALTGCATTEEITVPSGERGTLINCSGASQWSSCYRKAEQLCGASGYIVHDKNSDSETDAVVSEDSILIGSSTQRTLLISCR